MSDLISREAVMVSLMQYASGKKTIGQCIDEVPSIQPKTDVLDKIRTEIEALNPVDYAPMSSYEGHRGARYMKDDVLEIIDKYKAESEDKEWEKEKKTQEMQQTESVNTDYSAKLPYRLQL